MIDKTTGEGICTDHIVTAGEHIFGQHPEDKHIQIVYRKLEVPEGFPSRDYLAVDLFFSDNTHKNRAIDIYIPRRTPMPKDYRITWNAVVKDKMDSRILDAIEWDLEHKEMFKLFPICPEMEDKTPQYWPGNCKMCDADLEKGEAMECGNLCAGCEGY